MKLTRKGYTYNARKRSFSSVLLIAVRVVSGQMRLFLRCRQFCQHTEVLECCRVTGDLCAARDFLQKAPLDFPASRFWKRLGKADFIRFCNCANTCADVIAQFFFQITSGANSCFQRYKSDNSLTL